jgi:molybdate transport system substrate-binding protein
VSSRRAAVVGRTARALPAAVHTTLVLAAAGLAVLLACAAVAAAPPGKATLRVFAAVSLADAFGEIAGEFERAHPGTRVQFNLAGSQQLAVQIEQGAEADVFASADRQWMSYVVERARVAGKPAVFARNRMVAIVPRTNPARIGRLQDLARAGVKLVICAEAVPAGRYGREVLANLARAEGFDAGFARRALANVVSEEENVRSVVGKVQIGEADAGLCYRSDVTRSVSRYVRVLPIPDSLNVLATYPVAVLVGSPREELAREFVALVLSARGQAALEKHGLIPGATAAP